MIHRAWLHDRPRCAGSLRPIPSLHTVGRSMMFKDALNLRACSRLQGQVSGWDANDASHVPPEVTCVTS